MTINEFHREFGRLEKHFRVNEDDRTAITKDWFKALSHHHVDALSIAVDTIIREATDNFFPALGKITAAIRARMDRYEKTQRECARCNGNTWIEALPWKSNGIIYEGMARCPDCGVPPPSYTQPPYRVELTATEYAEYLAGKTPPVHMYTAEANHTQLAALNTIREVAALTPIAQGVSVERSFTGERD